MAVDAVDPEALRARIASRIREIAKRRKLPLSRLADQAEVSRAHLWEVLAGRRAPTSDILSRLATALSVDPVALVRPYRKKSDG